MTPGNTFSDDINAVAQQWRANAVITGQAFRPLNGRELAQVPTIQGECRPGWMMDAAGRLVIAKTFPDATDQRNQISREAIVARLGHAVDFAVPPSLIWEQAAPHTPTRYASVSYRAFPNSRDLGALEGELAKNILARDKDFAFSHAFNTWVMRSDCRSYNYVADVAAASIPQPPVAYIDWGRSLQYYGKIGKGAGPLFRGHMSASILNDLMFADRYRVAAVKQALQSDATLYERIQQVPDSTINESVDAVPQHLMTRPGPQALKDTLRYRRDNIRQLTLRGAGLE